MSVTFWMPQAPVERFEPYPDEEPGYMETRPVAPFTELNMANGNALPMLDIILPGLDHSELFGEWEGETLAQVQRNCMRALNSDARRATAHADTVVDGIMVTFGRTDDYVTRRLQQMLALVTVAIQHGFVVVYG